MEKIQKDNVKLRGRVKIEVRDKDGNLKHKDEGENLVVNAGLAEIIQLIGTGLSGTAFGYLAVGTDDTAAAAANTALGAEVTDSGLARASATVTAEDTNVTGDTLQLVKQWTVSGSKALTEVGIFNDASAGDMLGRRVYSVVNVESEDTFKITYQVVIQ